MWRSLWVWFPSISAEVSSLFVSSMVGTSNLSSCMPCTPYNFNGGENVTAGIATLLATVRMGENRMEVTEPCP